MISKSQALHDGSLSVIKDFRMKYLSNKEYSSCFFMAQYVKEWPVEINVNITARAIGKHSLCDCCGFGSFFVNFYGAVLFDIA